MSSHDEYATRYQEEWKPKEERYPATSEFAADIAKTVKMLTADGDLPVTRDAEPDFRTSMESRAPLVPCSNVVRQHAIVLFSAGDIAIRQRALDELKRLLDEDPNNGALQVLAQFDEWKRS